MTKKTKLKIVALIPIFIFVTIIGLNGFLNWKSFSIFALSQNSKFISNLLGSNEIPPITSKAAGMAEFTTMNSSISYNVIIESIHGVTSGHIHFGKPWENGKVVATLFNFNSPRNKVSEHGQINATGLSGPLKGRPISDLISAIENGNAYVNIHTQKNVNGEIRGQIIPLK